MTYDKRKKGSRGRALTIAIPEANLKEGDRLEPSSTLRDVGKFEDLVPPWVVVIFWRVALETRCKHRCPLFSLDTECSLFIVLCIDKLHTICVGICQDFAAAAVWAMICADIYNFGNGRAFEEIAQLTIMELKRELQVFYKQYRRAHPDDSKSLTEVQDLSVGMFGSRASPCCHMKGMETKWFVVFLVGWLSKYRTKLGPLGGPLCGASEAFVSPDP